MKVLVISDSHGNLANLKHVLGFAEEIKAGAIIHCGDWDNLPAVETVLESGIPLYAVLGNADVREDIAQSLRLEATGFDKTYFDVELGGKQIGIIHDIKRSAFSVKHLDILFFGHTHRQEEMIIGGIKAVNPGALEHDIEFAIYDTESNEVELVKL